MSEPDSPVGEVFEARLQQLPAALAFVEACCARHGVAQPDALRLRLVVEELFTNTVVHGHGGGADAPVRVALTVTADHLALHYEDSAPPFDPVQHLRDHPPDLDAPAEARPIGSLGLPLVAQMAERLAYARGEAGNCLTLALRRSP